MSTRLLVLTLTLVACSAEPGTAPGSDTGAERRAGSGSCAAARGRFPTTGFARDASGSLVAFDASTGRRLAQRPLGFEIVDIAWDARTRRVLVSGPEAFDVEGSRVHGFAFDGSDFTHEASSEVFPGVVRVLPTPSRVLVVAVDLASTWYELDDALGVVGEGAPLPRPVLVAEPGSLSVLALRREAPADVVYRVSGFAAGWSSAELALARSSPERAMALAAAGERAWLLGRGALPDGFVVGRFDTAGFPAEPPDFRAVPGGCGLGAPRAVGTDAAGCALVAATGAALDELAVVPTSPGASTACAKLGAPLARADEPIARNLAVDRGARRAWVATEHGVESFALEPSLTRVRDFAGAELRAPLAIEH